MMLNTFFIIFKEQLIQDYFYFNEPKKKSDFFFFGYVVASYLFNPYRAHSQKKVFFSFSFNGIVISWKSIK